MTELASTPSAQAMIVKPDNAVIVMALIIVLLLTIHLTQDVIYGYEPAALSTLIGVPFAGVWLYATLALSGRRSSYMLLVLGSLVAAIVPTIHMSGRGVRAEVVQSGGGLFFIWTLIALATSASVSSLLSIQGFWRLKRSLLGFVIWTLATFAIAGALFSYLIYPRR